MYRIIQENQKQVILFFLLKDINFDFSSAFLLFFVASIVWLEMRCDYFSLYFGSQSIAISELHVSFARL